MAKGIRCNDDETRRYCRIVLDVVCKIYEKFPKGVSDAVDSDEDAKAWLLLKSAAD